jgi:NitT/TauT family transport system ATP-binding protein
MIALVEVGFGYGGPGPVFDGFSWGVGRGEIWSVLGPSGCGKSTLLLLLAGLLEPQEGRILVGGERITRPRPRTGLILQEYGLLPWANVYDNVALGLRIRRFYGPDGRHVPQDDDVDRSEARARVEHWLERLDIAELGETYPGQISGGQRQRAAIARTLALQPDLLLMDEPFSSLDAPTRESLQVLTLELCAEAGLTVVLVTHNIEEAAFMGQRILLLHDPPNREARVVENDHVADDAYRCSASYQAACSSLRRRIDGEDRARRRSSVERPGRQGEG